MATTTNYSWTTPDDTALVKDGAAAIRTLGSSIDTTTKALNPSTTLGDIEYRSSTANTNTRLGIGSTGQVLTVASGVPSWATPASTTPSFVGAMVFKTADQTISNNTDEAITFTQTTDYLDTDGFHNPTSNSSRMTIPAGKGGKYLVFGNLMYDTIATSARCGTSIYLNGSQFMQQTLGGGSINSCTVSAIMTLAVNDYVELFGFQNSGGSSSIFGLSSGLAARVSAFGIQYLGA